MAQKRITDPLCLEYAERHTQEESPLLQELIQETQERMEYSIMLLGVAEARLLRMLVALTSAHRVLELGTFTGYSALCFAEALPDDGVVITCERNPKPLQIARHYIEKSPHGHKVCIREGDALDILASMDEAPFDLAFVDVDKLNYPTYYERLLPRVRQGGLLLFDNALWKGLVVDPSDEHAHAIAQLNQILRDDTRVENVLLTIGDGFHIARKR